MIDESPWPPVMGEFETLELIIAQGLSYGSFGDGEIQCIHGRGSMSQTSSPALAAELRGILMDPHPLMLPGIPTLDPKGPKSARWHRFTARMRPHLGETVIYGSAFIGARDQCPWIDTHEYCEMLRGMARGKRLCIVASEDARLDGLVENGPSVVHCPKTEAYEVIDDLVTRVLATEPELVLMMAGATAPCMASRLAGRVQAVDLGRGLGLLRMHRA